MRWRQRRRSGVTVKLLCSLTAIALAMAIGGGSALADDPKGYEFVDASPATLAPGWDGSFSSGIAIKNSGTSTIEPALLPKGGNHCAAKAEFTDEKKEILAGETKVLNLKISNATLPATCYLELQTLDEKKNVVARSVKQFKLSQRFMTCWVWLWLLLTVAFSWIATARAFSWVRQEYKPTPITACKLGLGSPAWDFSKSWTSTLTVAGALVAAALAASALPELTQHASKAGYGMLVLSFSALALLAPLPYLATMRGDVREESTPAPAVSGEVRGRSAEGDNEGSNQQSERPNKKYAVVYRGNGLAFLITCFMTLVAGLGQIAVLALLMDETFRTPSTWLYVGAACSALVVVVWSPLLLYSMRSMWLTFSLQKKLNESAQQKGLTDSLQLGPDRPSWPLL